MQYVASTRHTRQTQQCDQALPCCGGDEDESVEEEDCAEEGDGEEEVAVEGVFAGVLGLEGGYQSLLVFFVEFRVRGVGGGGGVVEGFAEVGCCHAVLVVWWVRRGGGVWMCWCYILT